MKVSDQYYEDEVVGGFYVTGMMKRCWAAQIEVLEDIVEVCRKNDIRYFADAGTLIGAIRHGGFIPWDDDLDIVMLREDYEKFLEHANELPGNYTVLNWRNRDDWNDIFSRVVNTTFLDFSPDFLERYHGFPFSAGVDIFVNDYLYKNEKKEQEREELLDIAYNLARNAQKPETKKRQLIPMIKQLEDLTGYKMDLDGNLVIELYGVVDKLLMEVKRSDAEEMVLMPAWVQYHSNRYRIEWYDDAVTMPFEGSRIDVPVCYDKILVSKYGNYLSASRFGGLHNYPYYHEQEKILAQKTGWKPSVYYFKTEDLSLGENIRSARRSQRDTLASQVSQIEALMQAQADSAIFDELVPQVQMLKNSLAQLDVQNNDVVFLPYRSDYWYRLAPFWEEEMSDQNTNVYVIPVPYFSMNIDGSTGALHYTPEEYPGEIGAISFEDYDLAVRHPRRIYFQVPFDGHNPAASVHPFFYSSELLKYTDELVYVPYFPVADISEEDEKGQKSFDYFVKMPGLINADRIILPSESQKETYIKKLVELCGEETKELWYEKIEVEPQLFTLTRSEDIGMKSIFYYSDICPFLTDGEQAVKKLRQNLEIFKDNSKDVRLVWHPYDRMEEVLREKSPEIYAQYKEIEDDYKKEAWGDFDDSADAADVFNKCVAYYGDPSPFVYQAQVEKKPVMIADINVLN